jgi:hypothetical protein
MKIWTNPPPSYRNARSDHAVSPHSERKQPFASKKLPWQRQRIFDLLQRQRRLPRRDASHQRNSQAVPRRLRQPDGQLDRARLPARAVQHPFLLDQPQMLPRRIDAPEPEPLANLLQRRNNAIPLLAFLNEGVNLPLPLGETLDFHIL